MNAVNFPEANVQLAKDQPEYQTLPVLYEPDAPGAPMTCCFELSAEEIAEIVATGRLWYRQLTFITSGSKCQKCETVSFPNAFHPIFMSTQKPF